MACSPKISTLLSLRCKIQWEASQVWVAKECNQWWEDNSSRLRWIHSSLLKMGNLGLHQTKDQLSKSSSPTKKKVSTPTCLCKQILRSLTKLVGSREWLFSKDLVCRQIYWKLSGWLQLALQMNIWLEMSSMSQLGSSPMPNMVFNPQRNQSDLR